MKAKFASGCVSFCFLFTSLANSALSQSLYFETFDDGSAASRWTAFPGIGFDNAGQIPRPMDTNFDTMPLFPGVDGVNDDFTGFAFDYSTVGIPSAPHSIGGSTTGLKLQANLNSNALGGFSASPNGLNLTGDYVVRFDHWANTLGPLPVGGSGSTNLSTFGILTSGTRSETILSADGLFFAYTADGEASADFRAYSVEDKNSYDGTAGEPHATYHAGTRSVPNALAGIPGAGVALYNNAFGIGRTVPQSQINIFGPSGTGEANQTGTLNGGAAGFRWNDVEIKKIGNLVTWTVNGTLLITVDMTDFSTPTLGGNISFGHADVNATSSTDPAAAKLIFSLVDNIRVTAILAGDYSGNESIDAADYTVWRDNLGSSTSLPNDDTPGVGPDDYDRWKANFGQTVAGGGGGSSLNSTAVPEPSAVLLLALAGMAALANRFR